MNKLIACFCRDDSAATAIEYGLIAAFMSIAVVAAFPTITAALSTAFTNISARLVVN